MISLLKCIIFCGRQGIALRGHRNEDFDPTSGRDPVENPGNFLALLRFRADAGDSALQCEFAASHRVTYRTPRVQNEILQCLAKYMHGEIVRKIKQAKFFSICADEVTDSSNKEQLPLVLRYLDVYRQENTEDFLAFCECERGITGQAMLITSSIQGTHWVFVWLMRRASATTVLQVCQGSTVERLHWYSNTMVLTRRFIFTA